MNDTAYVTPEYYTGTYHGEPIADAEFGRYESRAEDIIDIATRYEVRKRGIDSLDELPQKLVKKAVCAQMEYFLAHGFEAGYAEDGGSFTVGKVSVSNGGMEASGRLANYISPLSAMFLEQAGLLNRGVCWC